jgi:tetratricopeptide (TPR) repeat protein
MRLGDDPNADAAIEKLLTDYSEHKQIANAVNMLADECTMLNRFDKAFELYQYVIDHRPEDKSAMQSEMEIAKTNVLSLIDSGNDTAAQAELDILIADFNDRPLLPKAILEIGEQYYNIALRNKNKGLAAESEENFQKAIAVWERIITELPPSPTTPEAYFLSAENYRQLDQQKKAAEYYQKVVDNWPDYKYSWHAQFLVARIYKILKSSGAMLESEAIPKIKAAYERILQDYPDSSAVHDARKWLSRHKDLSQGEQK